MSIRPLVSVVVISYNQEGFIGACLESILSQQDVSMELIIADDASVDQTQNIIREYAKKDKRIIPILRNRNGGITQNLVGAMDSAKGRYIALCEADDFWTDTKKLSKQVHQMEKNPAATVCFHPVQVVKSDGKNELSIFPTRKDNFNIEELVKTNFIQTNSVMYKNMGPYSGKFYDDVLPLDWLLHVFHAKKGKISFINSVMSAYRKHETGIWWRDSENIRAFWSKNGEKHIKMFKNMSEILADSPELAELTYQSSKNFIDTMVMELRSAGGEDDAQAILKSHTGLVLDRLVDVTLQLESTKEELARLTDSLAYKIAEAEKLQEQRDQLDDSLRTQQASLSWKVTAPLRAMNRRLHK